MHRIVTLLPSATEIVCALGFGDQLVGRSHECDYPAAVRRLPAVTSPKFDPAGSSAAVDQRVKKLVRDALSVYRVDGDALRQLRPDVIVTQSQCEVCAVNMRDVEAAVADWLDGPPPTIVSLAPCNLADVLNDIGRVAMALGIGTRGIEFVAELNRRLTEIAHRVRSAHRPGVACIEWIEPLMAAGNWMPELVAMAGGVNLFGQAGQHSPWMKFEELAAQDPDVILVAPCGFAMARTVSEMSALTARPQWAELKAVKTERVVLADGNQYFNRPGPRIVESLEILAEILHPEAGARLHEGTGWRKFSDAVDHSPIFGAAD
jgi:iron complex transport system substrate-binding protein